MILCATSLVLLAGCQLFSTTPTIKQQNAFEVLEMYQKAHPQKPATLPNEGKKCGGIQKTPCTLPLFCVGTKGSSTGEGTCQNLIVDTSLDCRKELFKRELPYQAPVCATIKNQKYTFLNACEAARRGATNFTEGFCKPDASVPNNCKAKALGIGVCTSTEEAWEFDGEKCVQQFITGCHHEIPFKTQADCETTCK